MTSPQPGTVQVALVLMMASATPPSPNVREPGTTYTPSVGFSNSITPASAWLVSPGVTTPTAMKLSIMS